MSLTLGYITIKVCTLWALIAVVAQISVAACPFLNLNKHGGPNKGMVAEFWLEFGQFRPKLAIFETKFSK